MILEVKVAMSNELAPAITLPRHGEPQTIAIPRPPYETLPGAAICALRRLHVTDDEISHGLVGVLDLLRIATT